MRVHADLRTFAQATYGQDVRGPIDPKDLAPPPCFEAVVTGAYPSRASNGNLQILGARTEEPDTICVVYQGWWFPGILGLRQHIGPTDWPLETVALNIVAYGLDEPLGSRVDTLEPDENGVMWWTGTPSGSWARC